MGQHEVIKAMGFDPIACGGKEINGEVFKPDAIPESKGKCRICGKPGVWICGAGSCLCYQHQDDY